MAKKAYPLRINEQVLAALQRWADDDLRSLNAQIERKDWGQVSICTWPCANGDLTP